MRSHSNQENTLLKKIKDTAELEDIIPKQVNKKIRQANVKPLLLILAHMFKIKEGEDKLFAESMDEIRRLTP